MGTAEVTVRRAVGADVQAMAQLAERKRAQYATYQPVFWRPAAEARQAHTHWLHRLVDSADAITLVAERDGSVVGFVIATLVEPPPVYSPGGPSCFIDDFAMLDDGLWASAGAALLRAATAAAAGRGAVQVVVVAGLKDRAKADLLLGAGLTVASQWWVGAITD